MSKLILLAFIQVGPMLLDAHHCNVTRMAFFYTPDLCLCQGTTTTSGAHYPSSSATLLQAQRIVQVHTLLDT